MKNKVLKAVIVIALIITLTLVDFIFLGKNLITYAVENLDNSTNNSNVKFAAYFKTEEKEKTSQIEYQMDGKEIKLYMEVAVENNGYFDGVIILENNNFTLKPESLDEEIGKVEGNTINLNRVRSGDKLEIEVEIEPITGIYYLESMLNQESTLKIVGNYYEESTEKSTKIETEKKVTLALVPPAELETTLNAKVITNRIYKIGDANKRIVQIELKSTVVENAYPIKTTTFELTLPEGVEELQVISKGTYATNGLAEAKLEESNYEYNVESKILKILIENPIREDGKISWQEDAIDNIIVTLILGEEQELGEEYIAKTNVEFYGEEEIVKQKEVTYNLTEQADGIIRTSVENDENIYKGQLYLTQEKEYNSTTNIEVNYANIEESASIQEKFIYKTEDDSEELEANILYKSTTISKAEFDKILGEEGSLIIKDQDGNEITKITKDTEANENGNIIVSYTGEVRNLTIQISKAVETGIIRLNHVKAIKESEFTKEQITELKHLVEQATVKYSTAEHTFKNEIELEGTETVAELIIEPKTLSTAAVNESVKFAVTLRTDSEKYDLYKNPTLTIKLPEGVTKVSNIETVPLYLDDFTVDTKYNSDTREIVIKLTGEQTKYNGRNTNGYIEILADIKLNEKEPSKQEKVSLTYKNENAVAYKNGGKTEVTVQISGYSGLIAFNSITNHNLKTNSVSSKEEKVGSLKMHQDATEANFEIVLVNNTGEDIQDATVFGNLPVQGNFKIGEKTFNNAINATLKSTINTNGVGTVYYTANKNATLDLENAENGWNTNLSEVENPVLYMIVLGTMNKESNFVADYTMNIPENLQYNQEMKTTYVANYETSISSKTVEPEAVGLETGKVQVSLEAEVIGEKLEDGDTVRAGEVIRYKVTATNTGSTNAENVELSALVPEGTVYVKPMEDFEYTQPYSLYYEEDESTESVVGTVELLQSNQTLTYEYEVRVKSDITSGKAVNKATVTYNDDIEVSSKEISNNLESGDIRVTIKRRTDTSTILQPGLDVQYYIIIENISNNTVKDVNVNINLPEEIEFLNAFLTSNRDIEVTDNNITIASMEPNEANVYYAAMKVKKDVISTVDVVLTVTAEQNAVKYRSNAYDDKIYGYDIQMEIEATREKEYLDAGEIIEYNVEIKNNSEISTSFYEFKIEIPYQLTIQKIEIDGKESAIESRNISMLLDMEAKSSKNIKITAVVNYNPFREEIEEISTVAKILYMAQEKIVSEPIIHYLDSILPDPPVVEPEEPDEPIEPEKPDEPTEPIEPEKPDNPEIPQDPVINKYTISGKAWIDQNQDGELNEEDTILKDINVKLLNVSNNKFVRDSEDKRDLIVTTGESGEYVFENIPEGNYIVVFEYDITLFKPTTYKKNNVGEDKNSDVISKTLTINQMEKQYAATDEIELKQNISNIDLGLIFIKKFDIELDKYISKIIVQTSKDTTTYNYQNKDFAKVEIPAKQIVGSSMIVQYTIKVTNIGDVDAYINKIADYMPTGFKFSSELNTDWYEDDGVLYTNKLLNEPITPGESVELTLTLTKNKTDGNAELINNMAEISEAYNIYGITDINSKYGNTNKDENDLGSADLLISIQTGSLINYISLVFSMLAIIGVAAYMINKRILKGKF